jgi:hypothetical protein
MADRLFSPISTDGLESDAQAIERRLGSYDTGSLHYSPTDIYKDWKANAMGKGNVGTPASLNKIIAYLSKVGANIKENIVFNSKRYNTFAKMEEDDIQINFNEKTGKETWKTIENLRRKLDSISEHISAATDNGKNMLAGRLNLNLTSLSVVNTMIGLGIGRTRSSIFVNHPIIRTLSKRLEASDNAIQAQGERMSFKSTIIEGLLGDVTEQLTKEQLENLNILEEEGRLFQFEDNMLIDEIDAATPINSYKVLKAYAYFDGLSSELQKANKIVSLNKGVTGSMEEFDDVLIDILELEEKSAEGKSLVENIYGLLMENKYYATQVEQLKKVDKISSNFFIERTLLYNNLYNYFGNSVRNISKFRKEFNNKFRTGLISYISNRIIKDRGLDLSKYNYLLYPGQETKTLAARHRELLAKPEFRDNPFVTAIDTKLKNEHNQAEDYVGFDILETDTRIKREPAYAELLMRSYEDLHNSKDEEISNYAKDIFRYTVLKDGLQFRQGSIASMIAPTKFQLLAEGLKEFNRLVNLGDLPSAFSSIGVTPAEFRDEFGMLFFEYKGHQNLIKEVGGKTMQEATIKGGIKYTENAAKTPNGSLYNYQFILNPDSGLSMSKYFRYSTVEYLKDNKAIKYKEYNARLQRKEEGLSTKTKKRLLMRVESNSNAGVYFYKQVSTKGNLKQSPYAQDQESFAKVGALSSRKGTTTFKEEGAGETFGMEGTMDEFSRDWGMVEGSPMDALEVMEQGAITPGTTIGTDESGLAELPPELDNSIGGVTPVANPDFDLKADELNNLPDLNDDIPFDNNKKDGNQANDNVC